MPKKIDIADFSAELTKILGDYSIEVQSAADEVSEAVAKKMLAKIQATAPKKTGKFAKAWRIKENKGRLWRSFIIYAKSPESRIAHLLEFGHAKRNGGRVEGRFFLTAAVAEGQELYRQELEARINDI